MIGRWGAEEFAASGRGSGDGEVDFGATGGRIFLLAGWQDRAPEAATHHRSQDSKGSTPDSAVQLVGESLTGK
jgi:hypothetical protein